jgi:isopentenyl phosphate kinase
MVSLNKLILDTLIQEGIPTMTIQPSSLVITDNGRMQHMDIKIVSRLLELEIIPVLYGDVVLDSVQGFSILSGDQLVSSLAIKLGADRIILGIDVDGLYTSDPKIDPSASLIQHINLQELKNLQYKIGEAKVPDVTGGMRGKILELIPAIEQGIKAIIVNAVKPNNVYRALKGEKVIGTIIKKGDKVA